MADVDRAVRRKLLIRVRLGEFDPDGGPYAAAAAMDTQGHRELARAAARRCAVLLKNDGVLPLKATGTKIALIGPLAEQTRVLLGNYNGIPTHTVSILEGMQKEFAGATVNFVPGTQFLSKETHPVPDALLTTDGKPGARATYLKENISTLENSGPAPAVLATRIEPGINLEAQAQPGEAAEAEPVSIRWETTLTPTETGDYDLGVETDSYFRLSINGQKITNSDYPHGVETKVGRVHLEAGKGYALVVEYARADRTNPHFMLVWNKMDRSVDPKAIEAAQNADVVVAVVGITSELEGEEMQVSEPGFKGGDRTSLDLPKPEEDLLEALAGTHKPLVVVLTNGSALAVNWASQHANAILDAWYPGEEGGAAVAQTLSGKNGPAGRLPVTFYKSVDQLPPFQDYAMKGRTYRYFTGTPLYPFGYGLSYTKFTFSGLKVPDAAVDAGGAAVVEATVTNTGQRAGDEVAQLYLTFPDVPGAPLKALRGFERVHLEPGASQTVRFELKARDMSMVTEAGEPIVPEGRYTVTVGGGQPNTGAVGVTGSFSVKGRMNLPE
jgi:beta-glucosidase